MANYLLQPDGSSVCCDCATRATPCDNCSAATGACCICDPSIVTEEDCTDAGGYWQVNDCETCVRCEDLSESDCDLAGGEFHAGTDCDSGICNSLESCPIYGLNVSDVISGSGSDCDEAIANLPEYSGVFIIDGGPSPDPYSGVPSASYKGDFPGNCIIYRSRQKITFFDPIPSDCKVCWLVRTFDFDSNLLDEYVMSENLTAGATETSVYEFLEPSENGATFMLYPIAICCDGSDCCLEFGLPGSGDCNPYCTGTFQGNPGDPLPCSCAPNPC